MKNGNGYTGIPAVQIKTNKFLSAVRDPLRLLSTTVSGQPLRNTFEYINKQTSLIPLDSQNNNNNNTLGTTSAVVQTLHVLRLPDRWCWFLRSSPPRPRNDIIFRTDVTRIHRVFFFIEFTRVLREIFPGNYTRRAVAVRYFICTYRTVAIFVHCLFFLNLKTI